MLGLIAALVTLCAPPQEYVTAGPLTLAHARAIGAPEDRAEVEVLIMAINDGDGPDTLVSASSTASTAVEISVKAMRGREIVPNAAPLSIPTRAVMGVSGQVVVEIDLTDVDRAAFPEGVPLILTFAQAGTVEVVAAWGQTIAAPGE
jgi:hypothetical protein